MSKWPMVPLGEVLSRSEEQTDILPDKAYKEVTVRLWGKGVALRREATGGEIAATRRYTVRTGQFILSRIDARNGALGLVPKELEGAVVSNDFPVFDTNKRRLLPEFLNWLSKTSGFVDLCRAASEGTTNRVRLKEERFLQMEIPLPPLPEQQRIVEWIDAVAIRAVEAKRLRVESAHARDVVRAGWTRRVFQDLANKHPVKTLADFNPHVTSGPRDWGNRMVPSGERFYRAQDVLPEGRLATTGKAYIEPPATGQGTGAKLKPGDLMIVITGATVGRVAVYPVDSEPGYVSQHVAICRFDHAYLDQQFALRCLLSPYGQEQLLGQRYGQGKPGLNLTNIRNLRLPVPPIAVQQQVTQQSFHFETRFQQLAELQSESLKELEALLPSLLDRAFRGDLW